MSFYTGKSSICHFSIRRHCYFGSVDLSEAFYSIPILYNQRKYFRSWFNNQKYQFTALIMGLTSSPRVFTKVLKPVFATLRAKGHISTAYTDDSCLQGKTYDACLRNNQDTVSLMDSLGLTVYPEKSVLIPTQEIVSLLGASFDMLSNSFGLLLPQKITIFHAFYEIRNHADLCPCPRS